MYACVGVEERGRHHRGSIYFFGAFSSGIGSNSPQGFWGCFCLPIVKKTYTHILNIQRKREREKERDNRIIYFHVKKEMYTRGK